MGIITLTMPRPGASAPNKWPNQNSNDLLARIFDDLNSLNDAAGTLPSGSVTTGDVTNTITNDANGILLETSNATTGQLTQVIVNETQVTISFNDGNGNQGSLNIDATTLEVTWNSATAGGGVTITDAELLIAHTVQVRTDAPSIV